MYFTSHVTLLLVVLATGTEAQSTTSSPQGQCVNYLNRYTQENQCVYSFIVPKRDRDQCPGLEANMQQMQGELEELRQWKETVDRSLAMLSDADKNSRALGRAEAQVGVLTDQNNALTQERNTLQTQVANLEAERIQQSISSQEDAGQLAVLRDQYNPLHQNYSRLTTEYLALQRRLEDLQSEHEQLEMEYEETKNAKNCSDINKHLPSCAVIKQWGYTRSGHAMIDPDGEGGVEPFMVYCDMDSDPTTGITVIEHDTMPKTFVSGCNEPGCFSMTVNYNRISMPQIAKLMKISLACEQFIRYDCYDSKLLEGDTAWWVSRNGDKMTYWGGAAPGSSKCACGMTNDCVSNTEVCNCDADREEWLFDEGVLRDKNTLPVTKLYFGDVDHNADEKGNITLGPLKCKWNINMTVPSCDALSEAGVTGSGMYMIDPDGVEGPILPRRMACNLRDFVSPSAQNRTSLAVDYGRPSNPDEYIFTTCGQQPGHIGPTEIMCNNSYLQSNVEVRVRDGTQIWRVPRSGRYRIRAMAPSGYHRDPSKAGRGANMQAEFAIEANTEMKIIVGQKGHRLAGSGGTFVIRMFEQYTSQPLLIAGAGGSSANAATANPTIMDASRTTTAKDSSMVGQNFGNGGSDGNGGYRGGRLAGPNTPGGGAGFKTDGAKSSDTRFIPSPTAAIKINTNAIGNLAPGVGGTYTYKITSGGVTNTKLFHGGFGGGGSGSKSAAGGAGGYSGGGGGPDNGFSGGGGSFVRSNEASRYVFLLNSGSNGMVTIIYLGPLPETSDTS